MPASRRWIVCVTDVSQQRTYFGPYRSLDRAEQLQKQINNRLASDDREFGAWASIERSSSVDCFVLTARPCAPTP